MLRGVAQAGERTNPEAAVRERLYPVEPFEAGDIDDARRRGNAEAQPIQ
jgi:hypothetical protein